MCFFYFCKAILGVINSQQCLYVTHLCKHHYTFYGIIHQYKPLMLLEKNINVNDTLVCLHELKPLMYRLKHKWLVSNFKSIHVNSKDHACILRFFLPNHSWYKPFPNNIGILPIQLNALATDRTVHQQIQHFQ